MVVCERDLACRSPARERVTHSYGVELADKTNPFSRMRVDTASHAARSASLNVDRYVKTSVDEYDVSFEQLCREVRCLTNESLEVDMAVVAEHTEDNLNRAVQATLCK